MSIITGDIHGRIDKAKAFLAHKPNDPHVALGDYLDSFSEPPERQLEVLRLLMESPAVLLFGKKPQELAADVSQFLDGLPVSSYRESLLERLARFWRHNQFLLLLLSAYLVVKFLLFFLAPVVK